MPHKFFCHECESIVDLARHLSVKPKHHMFKDAPKWFNKPKSDRVKPDPDVDPPSDNSNTGIVR